MTRKEAKELLKKYNQGTATHNERMLVEETLMQYNEDEPDLSEEAIQQIGRDIFKNLPGPDRKNTLIKLWPTIAAAAAIVLVLLSIWTYFNKTNTTVQSSYAIDIPPGGNKATLTLANGTIINLSNASNGQLAIQAGIKITKANDGQLIYNYSERNIRQPETKLSSSYNTISTPKGGQYQIRLPDGSSIWLNAASSIKFPATFIGLQERKVELNGEAYFEISKDKKHPFVVVTNNQAVEVLGTHFNINAYSADTKTTLLEGSVKIKPAGQSKMVLLKPGEQAINSNGSIMVKPANIDLEVAWKEGKIKFINADIKSVMAMLERWYNIEAVYRGKPTEVLFTGSISRFRNISEILNVLESTGDVHFKIEERRIEILNN